MAERRRLPLSPFALLSLAGVGVAIVLIFQVGGEAVAKAVAAVGWRGLFAVCGLQLVSLAFCAGAWRTVAPGASYPACLMARALRDGASNIIGFAPALGEAMSARALALLGGLGAGQATAALVVDMGLEALAQAAYAVIAFALLMAFLPGGQALGWAPAAALGLLPLLALFALSRPAPLRWLQGRFAGLAASFGLAERIHDFTEAMSRARRGPGSAGAAFGLHLFAWGVGGAQVWAAAAAMGHPLTLGQAVALEGLVYAGRSALFVVPWAAGVQEGGFLLLGPLVGLDPAAAIALSLVLRARDLVVGAPPMLIWGWREALPVLRSRP
jgi:putative membrane protein